MRTLILLTLLLSTPGLHAQFSAPVIITEATPGPRTAAAALDADGDGDQDVVWALNQRVHLSLNHGDGTFERPVRIHEVLGTRLDLVPADADLDGDADLLIAGNGALLETYWLMNDGTGQFTPGAELDGMAAQSYAERATVVDLNGDTLPDVFLGKETGRRSALNLGNGLFGPVNTSVSGPSGAVPADMDLDGDLDLVGTNNQFRPVLRLDTGLTWNPADSVITTALGPVLRVEVFDVDVDGDSDLVAAGDQWVAVLLNDTANGFAPPLTITTGAIDRNTLRAGDTDGDGLRDLVVVGDADVLLLRNAGGGQFDAPVALCASNSFMVDLDLADLDTDGASDLLLVRGVGNGLEWYRNPGAPPWERGRAVLPGNGAGRWPYWGDMDGDGDTDLVINGTWVEQTSPGGFDRVHTTWLGVQNQAPADLNGDGLMDTFSALEELTTDSLVWCPNAPGGFLAPQTFASTPGNDGVVLPWDADADGDMDLMWANNPVIYAYRNDGSGQFSYQNLFNSGIQVLLPAIADLDGDGDPDVVTTGTGNANTATLVVRENLGNLLFTAVGASDLIGSFQPPVRRVRAADMDMDGDIDVVLQQSGPLSWYANNGPGNPWTANPIGQSALQDDHGWDLGDVDGDGDVDLAFVDELTEELLWMANDGTGDLGVPQLIEALGSYHGVHLADLDADLDADLLVLDQAVRTRLIFSDLQLPTQVGAIQASDGLHAFPNPWTEAVRIELGAPLATGEAVVLTDAAGRELKRWSTPGTQQLWLARGDLDSGLLLIRREGLRPAALRVVLH
ncbi:MAG: VCBS repeat-containing protein [Flavobacteriales bacterium]|nr:VCBS repeat-containing protein [Flavobacteriales bacterium]